MIYNKITLFDKMFGNFFPSDKESIYFITFHKTASSLFSDKVLGNFKRLQHFDPEKKITNDHAYFPHDSEFHSKGFIYGPIRLSSWLNLNAIKLLIEIVEKNISQCRSIFLVRDPRDIIVSSFYSFIHSHTLSLNAEVRDNQVQFISWMKTQNIDEYALNISQTILKSFEHMFSLYERSQNKILLRYEDLVEEPVSFIKNLNDFAPITKLGIDILKNTTRPNESIDITHHKRSGKCRQFESEFNRETNTKLIEIFSPILQKLKYSE